MPPAGPTVRTLVLRPDLPLRTNATVCPSGDQTGMESSEVPLVSCVAPLPSVPALQMCSVAHEGERGGGARRRGGRYGGGEQEHRGRGEHQTGDVVAVPRTRHAGPPAVEPASGGGRSRRHPHHTRAAAGPRRPRPSDRPRGAGRGAEAVGSAARGGAPNGRGAGGSARVVSGGPPLARTTPYVVVQQVVFSMGSPCTSPGDLAESPFGSTGGPRRSSVVLVPATCLLHDIVVPPAADHHAVCRWRTTNAARICCRVWRRARRRARRGDWLGRGDWRGDGRGGLVTLALGSPRTHFACTLHGRGVEWRPVDDLRLQLP